MENNSIDLGALFIGTVLKLDKENRKLGVFIPRLMAGLYDGEAQEYIVPTNSGVSIPAFDNYFSPQVTKLNYMWVKSWDYSAPLPDIGSKVEVRFIDENINLGFWRKFNPNNDYNIIEEEKYSKLINISTNEKYFEVMTEDQILIETPEYLKIVMTQNDENKTKTISIQENLGEKGLKEKLENLENSMSYISNTIKETFITKLPTGTSINDEKIKELMLENLSEGKNKILNTSDLLAANNEYSLYHDILDGYETLYTKNKNYLELAETKLDENTFPKLEDIQSEINEKYEIFLNSLNIKDILHIKNTNSDVKNYYDTIKKIKYSFIVDGQDYEIIDEVNVFTELIVNPFVLPEYPENEIPEYNGDEEGNIVFAGWYTNDYSRNENNEIVLPSELITKDITLYPGFFGLTINTEIKTKDTDENNSYQYYSLNIVNDLNLQYKILDKNNNDDEVNIDDIEITTDQYHFVAIPLNTEYDFQSELKNP